MKVSESARDPHIPSAEGLIDAAAHGELAGQRLASAAAVNERVFAITIAALVASFLLAVEFVFPSRNPLLVWGAVALYGIGVIGVALWNQRRRRAARPGWSKRYGVGFGMTMAFYAVGIALSVSREPSSLVFWVPFALLTAAPLVVAALRSGRE